MPEDEWITTKEAAVLLDVVPDHVTYLGKEGKLIRKAVDGRTYLYAKESVIVYRDSRQNKGIRAARNNPNS